jgi:UPF0042 nucleotide-binding protein
MTEREAESTHVVIVTGLSGAGHSTVINALEDARWETFDNVPLSLVPAAVDAAGEAGLSTPGDGPAGKRLAFAMSSRTRGVSPESLMVVVGALRARPGCDVTLMFIDADDESLLRRYAETRRRHPAAPDDDPAAGIARERALLGPLRDQADLVLDTTALTPHEAKAEAQARLGVGPGAALTVAVQSFSVKRGAPREADMVFDCRFLRNPHWDEALRPLDGRDAPVAAFVADDPLCAPFLDQLAAMLLMLLPAYKAEGKAHLGIALGCTGGRHRSVFIAESLASRLEAGGWAVKLRHRDLP